MRVENSSPRSSCASSPRASSSGCSFSNEIMSPSSDNRSPERANSRDDMASLDSVINGANFLDHFTPRTNKAGVDSISSYCMSTIRPDKNAGVSPVNLPLSFNIPIKIEDAPAEDREAARALVCLGERGGSPSPQTLGQKRGFGELSINTSFGGVVTNAGLKKRRAVAAARKISVKLYGGSGDMSDKKSVALMTPSFQRTLSVLADTATELCGQSFPPRDSGSTKGETEDALCIELLQNF
jgi:hypothetical protein